jgi:UDP-N-acetyl-D-galactosamine dehydrogenase
VRLARLLVPGAYPLELAFPASMRRIAVLGLGYVGLAVARAFARRFPGTLGFDRDAARVAGLQRGEDRTGALAEVGALEGLELASDPRALAGRDFFVIAVPTPIDAARRPDLAQLAAAAETVGHALRPGAIVVLESTVYPGLTDEWLAPRLAQASGLARGRDFTLGYSPERINPGDPEHAFERVRKVIAAEDARTLDVLEACYGAVVEAGVHRAPSIRVAEAAKGLENVQRDLNVALVNELARICQRLGLDTREVLATAATKWNFLDFRPGLVGGHCIGVDPYYLAARAAEVGVEPRVILAGRAVNDGMSAFVAGEVLARLERVLGRVRGARLGVLGVAFKPDVGDVRNSRVPELLARLSAEGVELVVHDPRVDRHLAAELYGLELAPEHELEGLDALLLAVPHRGFAELAVAKAGIGPRLVLDLSGTVPRAALPSGVELWRL